MDIAPAEVSAVGSQRHQTDSCALRIKTSLKVRSDCKQVASIVRLSISFPWLTPLKVNFIKVRELLLAAQVPIDQATAVIALFFGKTMHLTALIWQYRRGY